MTCEAHLLALPVPGTVTPPAPGSDAAPGTVMSTAPAIGRDAAPEFCTSAVGLAPGTPPPAAYDLGRPGEGAVWRATGSEEPVFLDRSGRRGPVVRVVAAASAAASAGWLMALVSGSIGFASLPTAPVVGDVAPPVNAPALSVARLRRPKVLVAQGARRRAEVADPGVHHRHSSLRVIRA